MLLKQSIPQNSKDEILFSFLFQPIVWVSTLGPTKYSQPKKYRNFKTEPWEKYCLKKNQDSSSQVYKELEILNFFGLLYLQNCLFMFQIKTHQRLANSVVHLEHCGDDHNYLTKSKAKGLLDILFVNTVIFDTQSVKYNCIVRTSCHPL